jgi:hypothetical protein
MRGNNYAVRKKRTQRKKSSVIQLPERIEYTQKYVIQLLGGLSILRYDFTSLPLLSITLPLQIARWSKIMFWQLHGFNVSPPDQMMMSAVLSQIQRIMFDQDKPHP